MDKQILNTAARVIARADRTHPADAILRAELKRERGVSPEFSRATARAVFSYYRWLGWLSTSQPLTVQLGTALDLADRYRRDAASFSDCELVERSVPEWIRSEMSVEPAWVRSLQSEPILWLRVRPGQREQLAGQLKHVRLGPGLLRDALAYLGEEDLFRSEQFLSGRFEIQDISSQAVGVICGPRAGETWWDACAGEGGKTLHLADLMENRGLIWASDRSNRRLQQLKRRAARARIFNYRLVFWDGSERLPTKTLFDGILLDAPCSGIGTWQRNPHARWTTTPDDVRELAEIQSDLLRNVVRLLKPAGKLIYSVCTLPRAETVGVVERMASQSLPLEPWPTIDPFAPGSAPRTEHWFRTEQCSGNGMFVAGWKKS